MGNSPPTLNRPPIGSIIVERENWLSRHWVHWFETLHGRVGGAVGRPIVGDVAYYQVAAGQAALASAGSVILLDAAAAERWRVREIFLSGDGTNFSGGGGDRLLSVSDGTAIWTVIPAATLQTLAVARWGDTGAPFPATAADLTAQSAAGTDITLQYSGGATDYTAGECTLVIAAERMV